MKRFKVRRKNILVEGDKQAIGEMNCSTCYELVAQANAAIGLLAACKAVIEGRRTGAMNYAVELCESAIAQAEAVEK